MASPSSAIQLMGKFKIDLPEAEALVELRDSGECEICGRQAETEKIANGARSVLCIDHERDTVNIRGILCTQCNSGIGNLQDDINVLRRAVDYLA